MWDNFKQKMSSENTVETRFEVDTTEVRTKPDKSTKGTGAEDYKEMAVSKNEKKESLKLPNEMPRIATVDFLGQNHGWEEASGTREKTLATLKSMSQAQEWPRVTTKFFQRSEPSIMQRERQEHNSS